MILYINLNVKETKETVVELRVNNGIHDKVIILDKKVERVEEYRYLAVVIDRKSTGSGSTLKVYKNCQQRIHFLRILENSM